MQLEGQQTLYLILLGVWKKGGWVGGWVVKHVSKKIKSADQCVGGWVGEQASE
jgi:hypothetical protein